MRRVLLTLLLSLALSACAPAVDPCESADATSVTLGTGAGGAFVPYEDGQEVGLASAPQGGFGVTTRILTTGLRAGDEVTAEAQLDVLVDGSVEGSFLLEEAALLCSSDAGGGLIVGAVVGFDPDVYSTDDDFLALDGQVIDLDVTVIDPDGRRASIVQSVMLRAGG